MTLLLAVIVLSPTICHKIKKNSFAIKPQKYTYLDLPASIVRLPKEFYKWYTGWKIFTKIIMSKNKIILKLY